MEAQGDEAGQPAHQGQGVVAGKEAIGPRDVEQGRQRTVRMGARFGKEIGRPAGHGPRRRGGRGTGPILARPQQGAVAGEDPLGLRPGAVREAARRGDRLGPASGGVEGGEGRVDEVGGGQAPGAGGGQAVLGGVQHREHRRPVEQGDRALEGVDGAEDPVQHRRIGGGVEGEQVLGRGLDQLARLGDEIRDEVVQGRQAGCRRGRVGHGASPSRASAGRWWTIASGKRRVRNRDGIRSIDSVWPRHRKPPGRRAEKRVFAASRREASSK